MILLNTYKTHLPKIYNLSKAKLLVNPTPDSIQPHRAETAPNPLPNEGNHGPVIHSYLNDHFFVSHDLYDW